MFVFACCFVFCFVLMPVCSVGLLLLRVGAWFLFAGAASLLHVRCVALCFAVWLAVCCCFAACVFVVLLRAAFVVLLLLVLLFCVACASRCWLPALALRCAVWSGLVSLSACWFCFALLFCVSPALLLLSVAC